MEQPQPQSEFDRKFPLEHFDRATQWTAPNEKPDERVLEYAHECLKGTPKTGVITFEELPDGGYEIRYYRSRELGQKNSK
jgi:hypothetical protein